MDSSAGSVREIGYLIGGITKRNVRKKFRKDRLLLNEFSDLSIKSKRAPSLNERFVNGMKYSEILKNEIYMDINTN